MHSATHGPWCNARTWPTTCRECAEPVFFFTCRCGSGVFFDELGHPWPIHHCFMKWGRSLPHTRRADSTRVVQIGEGITARRPPEDFSIAPAIIHVAKTLREKPDDHPIEAIRAYKNSKARTITGVLREKTVEENIFKEFDIDPSKPLATAPLGSLATQPVGRITIHTLQVSPVVLHSYTIWLPREWISQAGNMIGVTVRADIAPVSALNRETVWHATRYEVLGGR